MGAEMDPEFLKVCKETCEYLYSHPSQNPPYRRIFSDPFLREQSKKIKAGLFQVFEVAGPAAPHPQLRHRSQSSLLAVTGGPPVASPAPHHFFKAITWNLERGKNFEAILEVFKTTLQFQNVDFFFLTEVDWGMARSGNRNIAGDLGKELGYYAYFAPSYFNLTQGHGSERHVEGKNLYGLHGKAILSKYPLENLKSIGMPNATNKLKSKESRLGEKRALLGDFKWKDSKITLACAHLDAFSSPKTRMLQLRKIVEACAFESCVLMAGDWNTNSINSTSGPTLFKSMIHQLLIPGPQKMIREHFPNPYRKFDRHLFQMLSENAFEYESLNEQGVGTFDLFENDHEMGAMVSDQYPRWLIKKVNDLIIKSGGLVSLKLDWFAGRNIEALDKKVLRLKKGEDYRCPERPSDHHPVYLSFNLINPTNF